MAPATLRTTARGPMFRLTGTAGFRESAVTGRPTARVSGCGSRGPGGRGLRGNHGAGRPITTGAGCSLRVSDGCGCRVSPGIQIRAVSGTITGDRLWLRSSTVPHRGATTSAGIRSRRENDGAGMTGNYAAATILIFSIPLFATAPSAQAMAGWESDRPRAA